MDYLHEILKSPAALPAFLIIFFFYVITMVSNDHGSSHQQQSSSVSTTHTVPGLETPHALVEAFSFRLPSFGNSPVFLLV